MARKSNIEIRFNDTDYKYIHHSAPKGLAEWGFVYEGHEFYSIGSFTRAKQLCREEIRRNESQDSYKVVYVDILP